MARPPSTFMGPQHVAIKVHDIGAAIDFYVNKLGFTISEIHPPGSIPGMPFGLCFMRSTPLHHDVNLVFWPDGAIEPPDGRSFDTARTGLHHFALQVGTRKELEAWAAYLKEQGIEIFWGPSIHSPTHPEGDGFWGENHALYIADPSGNCIEIFCDMGVMDPYTNRVNEAWFRDRLGRDGHPSTAADPPPAWRPDFSFLGKKQKR